jgi:hypothetical protein
LKVVVVATVIAASCVGQSRIPQPAESWLDRPLVNWNAAEQSLSKAPPPYEPLNDLLSRCRLSLLQSTPGERALVAAGWIPFRPNGEQLVRGDVEIVGGMTGADGMCRPIVYNVFVFVDSGFSGTLSPDVMTSRVDGASGSVGLAGDDITVSFARYAETDPLCCPSGRVQVGYRIERAAGITVVPVSRAPIAVK